MCRILEHQLLGDGALFFDLGQHVATVAVLQHQVVVVGCLLEGQQFYYVSVVARFKHLDLVLEQFVKLSWDEEH